MVKCDIDPLLEMSHCQNSNLFQPVFEVGSDPSCFSLRKNQYQSIQNSNHCQVRVG
jgi:hypothetical protein